MNNKTIKKIKIGPKRKLWGPGVMANTYNPSYTRGSRHKDHNPKLAQAKIQDAIRKNT
jgi:hypothetical protein